MSTINLAVAAIFTGFAADANAVMIERTANTKTGAKPYRLGKFQVLDQQGNPTKVTRNIPMFEGIWDMSVGAQHLLVPNGEYFNLQLTPGVSNAEVLASYGTEELGAKAEEARVSREARRAARDAAAQAAGTAGVAQAA